MAGQGWNIAGNLITFAQLKRRMSMNLKALLEPVGTFAWWRSMFAIVLGCLIMAVGYSYFVSPYNIVPGGVYGGNGAIFASGNPISQSKNRFLAVSVPGNP